jgi:Na+-driven multidrug efflux pump
MGVYGFWAGLVIASSIASLSMLYRWNLVSKAKIALAA